MGCLNRIRAKISTYMKNMMNSKSAKIQDPMFKLPQCKTIWVLNSFRVLNSVKTWWSSTLKWISAVPRISLLHSAESWMATPESSLSRGAHHSYHSDVRWRTSTYLLPSTRDARPLPVCKNRSSSWCWLFVWSGFGVVRWRAVLESWGSIYWVVREHRHFSGHRCLRLDSQRPPTPITFIYKAFIH